jgi:hypothetical protein
VAKEIIPVPEPEPEPEPSPAPGSDDARLTTEFYEEAAFAALMGGAKHKTKNSKKCKAKTAAKTPSPKVAATSKPKAAASPKAVATPKPKVAATPKPKAGAIKRPAAAMGFPPELIPSWTSDTVSSTKEKFGSKYYHKAKAFAHKAGHDDLRKGEIAREAYGRAVALWLEHNC